MSPHPLDPRRNAVRPDLADARLKDRVTSAAFATGEPRQVNEASVPLRGEPNAGASWTTEVLFGEIVRVFEDRAGWAWVQLESDGYVGYLPSQCISAEVHAPTHAVSALGSTLYPAADCKSPPLMHLALNAALGVAEMGPHFARLAGGGFVPAQHVAKLHLPARDYVDVAERFLGSPYVWGGKTQLGLDCSGLVQVSFQACGIACPRDSDMQESELGSPIAVPADLEGLQRGDLIFWKSHVGMLVDPDTLLHANAHHMSVVAEPLFGAVERIAATGSPITSIRRMRGVSV